MLAAGKMTPRLMTGRIVWSDVADSNGHRKLRPAVIFTPTDDIAPPHQIDVVAVTSRLEEPLPNDHVVLPWHAQGHPRTGLNRRCAAVCSWLAQISEADIKDVAGIVPASPAHGCPYEGRWMIRLTERRPVIGSRGFDNHRLVGRRIDER